MQYTLSELRRLFVVLIEATGAVPSTLGTRISQNPKLIPRLLDGDGCASMTGERASDYIDANWPEHLPWPEDVPRRDYQAPQPTRPAPPGWELVYPGHGQPPFWRELAIENAPPAARRARREFDSVTKPVHATDN